MCPNTREICTSCISDSCGHHDSRLPHRAIQAGQAYTSTLTLLLPPCSMILPPVSFYHLSHQLLTRILSGEELTLSLWCTSSPPPMLRLSTGGETSLPFHWETLVSELVHLFKAYAERTTLEAIALTAAMVIPSLLLQKPHCSSKTHDHIACLEWWLQLWKASDINSLILEGRTIQHRLPQHSSPPHNNNQNLSRNFSKLMMSGKPKLLFVFCQAKTKAESFTWMIQSIQENERFICSYHQTSNRSACSAWIPHPRSRVHYNPPYTESIDVCHPFSHPAHRWCSRPLLTWSSCVEKTAPRSIVPQMIFVTP